MINVAMNVKICKRNTAIWYCVLHTTVLRHSSLYCIVRNTHLVHYKRRNNEYTLEILQLIYLLPHHDLNAIYVTLPVQHRFPVAVKSPEVP